jgi:hypothetical protein
MLNNNNKDEFCYICYDENTNRKLFSPCACKTKVHEKCLIYWIFNRPKDRNIICEVCKNEYNNISISKTYLKCFNCVYKCLFVMLLFIINYFIALLIFVIWHEQYVTIGLKIFVFLFLICFCNLTCLLCGIIWNVMIVNASCMRYFLSSSICFNDKKYFKSPLIKETFSQEQKNKIVIELV